MRADIYMYMARPGKNKKRDPHEEQEEKIEEDGREKNQY